MGRLTFVKALRLMRKNSRNGSSTPCKKWQRPWASISFQGNRLRPKFLKSDLFIENGTNPHFLFFGGAAVQHSVASRISSRRAAEKQKYCVGRHTINRPLLSEFYAWTTFS